MSAKADYALRAMLHLSAAAGDRPVTADDVARGQDIPVAFLLGILADMRSGGLLISRRGRDGGWLLARPAGDISLADILRIADGPIVSLADRPLSTLTYQGAAAPLSQVWQALRASVRQVLETVSLADVVADALPDHVRALALNYQGQERSRHRAG